jgi:hypothetical protein
MDAVFLQAVFARLPLGCTLRVTGLEAMPGVCCVLFARESYEAVLFTNDQGTTAALGGLSLGGGLSSRDKVRHAQRVISAGTRFKHSFTTHKNMHHQWQSIVHSLLKSAGLRLM